MAESGIEWSGVEQMVIRMREYAAKVLEAVRKVALYWTSVLEQYAKENASWVDRTANARQSLRAYLGDAPPDAFGAEGATPYPEATDLAENVVAIYLSHGMSYGVFLELAHQGAYAIILPTLEAHYQKIMDMIRGIFG